MNGRVSTAIKNSWVWLFRFRVSIDHADQAPVDGILKHGIGAKTGIPPQRLGALHGIRDGIGRKEFGIYPRRANDGQRNQAPYQQNEASYFPTAQLHPHVSNIAGCPHLSSETVTYCIATG
jgi:hypothetical protein